MKKLLLICFLFIGVIFISGCIDEEKANSKSSVYSQTSEPLIKLSDLPKEYYSTGYETRALSQGVSFRIPKNFDMSNDIFNPLCFTSTGDIYEGDIPSGMRRISTSLGLVNEDNDNIGFIVSIFELDSDSGFKEYVSEYENYYKKYIEEIRTLHKNRPESEVTYNSKKYFTSLKVEYDDGIDTLTMTTEMETNLFGDNSIIVIDSKEDPNTKRSQTTTLLIFTSGNYLVSISSGFSGSGVSIDTMRKETLKIGNAIEKKIN